VEERGWLGPPGRELLEREEVVAQQGRVGPQQREEAAGLAPRGREELAQEADGRLLDGEISPGKRVKPRKIDGERWRGRSEQEEEMRLF
jgi:hypothetical protein